MYAFLFVMFFSGLMQLAHGQPTAMSRTFDGKAINQRIVYILMLAALLVSYLVH